MTKCVHRPRRVPGLSPRQTEPPDRLRGADRRPARASAGGRVAEQRPRHQRDGEPRAGRHQERGAPAVALEQGDQRVGGGDLADLPENPRQLGQQRDPGGRKPHGDQPQGADERHRVAGAHQHPSGHGRAHAVRRRQDELAAGHEHRAAGDEPSRADAIEQDADRDLKGGVDRELQDGEQGQDGCRRAEAPLRLHGRHPERRPLEYGHGIGQDREREDEPRTAWGRVLFHPT